MTKISRRAFLGDSAKASFSATAWATGAAAATLAIRLSGDEQQPKPPLILNAPKIPFELGMASYTFRAFGLDEALAMTKRLGLKKIALKSMHLPLDSPQDRIRTVAAKVKSAGFDLYGGGVIYMTTEAEVRQAFAYAKAAAMTTIIGVPNPELLPLVESLVKSEDIRLAIHNHGPTDKLYPTAESVCAKIKDRDPRLGLCLDAGHEERCGLSPAASVERSFDRLLDVHIKDMTASKPEGTAVEIGRGVIDIPKLLRTLVRLNFRGVVSLEYEKDEKDPLPGAAESIGYVRGSLAGL